jgi:diguanylate cyclase (GGDEF)-like protein
LLFGLLAETRTMQTMSCDEALALIFTALERELSGEEQGQLDGHLEQCPYCEGERARYYEQHALLQRTFEVDPAAVDEIAKRLRTKIVGPAKSADDRLSLLVVDDEEFILRLLAGIFRTEPFHMLEASNAEQARALFDRHRIDIILSDQRMPGGNGLQLLEWVKENYPRTIRLLMTAYYKEDVDEAIETVNRGKIYHYLTKPFPGNEAVILMLRQAAEKFRLELRQDQLMDELRQLNLDLEQRVLVRTRALEAANWDLREKNKILTRLALTDPLTGLPNRRAIVQLAEQELRRRNRYPSPLGVGIIDIDHFKDINTRLLHTGGDKVLTDLARCLQSSVRNADLIGRIGGEEFLVIAPETDLAGISALGERIRGKVEQHPFSYHDKPVKLTVSLGFVVADDNVPADFPHLKEAAAQALRDAKHNGRNRVELRRYSPAA